MIVYYYVHFIHDNYESERVGLFSTEEKANKAAEDYQKKNNTKYTPDIEIVELDKNYSE